MGAVSRRRDSGSSSSSESDGPSRKTQLDSRSERGQRSHGGDEGRDSPRRHHRDRDRRRDERRSSDDDDNSEGRGGRKRRSKEEDRHRRSDEENREKRRRISDDSSPRRRENRDRGVHKDTRKEEEEVLPPPPPLPPPPFMPERKTGSSDEDRDSDGRGRTRRSKEHHQRDERRRQIRDDSSPRRREDRDKRKEEALPPPPSLPPPPPMPKRQIGSSDEDGDSEGRMRRRRPKEEHHRRRSDERRHRIRDDSSPPRREDKDTRKEDKTKKGDALPPPPPLPPMPEGRIVSSDEDSDSEGRRRRRRPKDDRHRRLSDERRHRIRDDSSPRRREDKDARKEDMMKGDVLPPPPPMPPIPEGRIVSSDEDSDSEGRGRRRRSKDERHRRRKKQRSRSPERRRRTHDDSSPRRREDTDTRKEDTRKEEALPPLPPLPPVPEGRSGGIYIPPFRLARMMKEVDDKSSEAYQRLSWDALRKSINGLVNKVNATNIKNIIPELLSENLIRGRGLFCRSCMKSQMASPGFTDVFAALVAVVNTRFPDIGKLLLKRIVLQLKRAYKRNDKPQLLAATKFVAHLVNQQVAHEIIALELLTLLLENPSDDSVEVAVGFVKECGALLQDLSPQGLFGIFERFRGILHEAELDKRVRYLIEDLFGIRRAKFEGYPAVREELDLVEQEDQYIHEISLEDDDLDPETNLDVFKSNPQFLEDEKAYEDLKKNILGSESSEDEGSDAASEDEDEEESEEDEDERMEIRDETETNLVNLRRTIYLTIMSSVDFEEAGHKLLKIRLEPGQEMELCIMMLECCSQERTYLRYYGLLGQRFCMINKVYQENFETCFVNQYSMIHRLETNKLRNVAKFFAHLLGTSALPWHVLAYIRLTEEDTTSSSRIFIKILFQELSEHLGIRLLNERLNDPTMQDSLESIFPKDNPKNTRFSINFFTSIGLGGITESLREYLKNMPRLIMQQQKHVSDSDGGSGSSSSSDESSSGSDTESESSSDESERNKSRKRRRK